MKKQSIDKTKLFKLVTQLRKESNLGLMDCKNAIEEANYDLKKAKELLFKKGILFANKRSANIANQGIVDFVSLDYNFIIYWSLNCETDFGSNSPVFQNINDELSTFVKKFKFDNIDKLLSANYNEKFKNFNDFLLIKSAELQEKIVISKYKLLKSTNLINCYNHKKKILGIVECKSLIDNSNVKIKNNQLKAIKDVALHVCAMNPLYLTKETISEKEIEIILNRIQDNFKDTIKNKPLEIQKRIIDGKLEKELSQKTLWNQSFVKNDRITIGKYLAEHNLQLINMQRLIIKN